MTFWDSGYFVSFGARASERPCVIYMMCQESHYVIVLHNPLRMKKEVDNNVQEKKNKAETEAKEYASLCSQPRLLFLFNLLESSLFKAKFGGNVTDLKCLDILQ